MKIDIWSDHVCPFCYIGKRRLEKAIEQTGIDEETEIIFHSFELNPDTPGELKVTIHQALANKYGMTLDQARAANQRVGNMAEMEGLEYRFDTMRYTNTFDAHRLCHLARETGRAKELIELIMKGYFTEGKLISDHMTLTEIAVEAGMDAEKVRAVLQSDQYSEAVRQEEAEAHKRQITGVPYFVFNDKYALSGAQETAVFIQTINRSRAE